MFGRVVRRRAHPRLEFMDTRDGDDAAAPARRDHAARCCLHADEGAVEIRVQGIHPGLNIKIEESCAIPRAGVIDKDVHPAELLGEGVDDGGSAPEISGVKLPYNGRPAEYGGLPRRFRRHPFDPSAR